MMIPLSIPNLKGRELQYIKRCIDTNWVSSSGNFVNEFEDAICGYVKSKYAVACVNGTAGLQIALKLSGVERNDEVIVPTLTFIAPVNVIDITEDSPPKKRRSNRKAPTKRGRGGRSKKAAEETDILEICKFRSSNNATD